MTGFAALVFFSGFSLNLMLQMGVGLRDFYFEWEGWKRSYLLREICMFITVLIIWHFAVYALFPLSFGFFVYFLLFPLSFLLYSVFGSLVRAFFKRGPREDEAVEKDAVNVPYAGENAYFLRAVSDSIFIFTASVFTIQFASNSLEAVFAAAGFFSGVPFAVLILKAVRNRTAKEKIPLSMRGLPIMLVSAGLLSLIFTAVTEILLK
ncbi:MAG: hypothetical protein LBC53_08170 [Spirochaetaceae bacterium]|jgi:hypothetical protein|nr:hypothetical protein [Spirochaetaceae bacterium]